MQRLKWGGNQEAQRQADEAFKRLKPKPKKIKASKKKKRRNSAYWKVRAESQYGPPKPPKFKGSYYEYLDSEQWKIVRNAAFAAHGKQCQVCHGTSRLQVHHKHYKTLFREQPCDLEVLCHGCHLHQHEGDKGFVMDPLTREFVNMKF